MASEMLNIVLEAEKKFSDESSAAQAEADKIIANADEKAYDISSKIIKEAHKQADDMIKGCEIKAQNVQNTATNNSIAICEEINKTAKQNFDKAVKSVIDSIIQ